MSELLAIIATAAIVDNIVFSKMLGLCPFIGLSKQPSLAAGVGTATTIVLTLACMAAWIFSAITPDNWQILQPLAFIVIVACLVQIMELSCRLFFPLLHRHLGVFLPLIATNCAILGIMLLALRGATPSFWQAAATGLGGGIGFFIAVFCLSLIRQRIVTARVPAAFRDAPLSMITAGWMALAFSALAGIR